MLSIFLATLKTKGSDQILIDYYYAYVGGDPQDPSSYEQVSVRPECDEPSGKLCFIKVNCSNLFFCAAKLAILYIQSEGFTVPYSGPEGEVRLKEP